MAIAKGVAKRIALLRETAFGSAPGPAGAQYLRNVTSTLDFSKDTYQSNEKRTDYQVADFRHGVGRVAGDVNGELSLGTYAEFFAAALRKDWTAGASFTAEAGQGITVDNTAKTITRAGGSWIAGGFKVGDVIRAGGLDDAINGKNLRIVALTATVMTVAEAPGADVAAPNETCIIAVAGKKLWVPTSNHLNLSFAIEHHFSDIDESELFLGCMVNTVELGLPPTGMSTFRAGLMGKSMAEYTGADAPYLTTPAAETDTAIMASVNGSLRIGGTDVATVTGLTMNINANITGDPVVGSNVIPELFPGRVVVTGQFTCYYEAGSSIRSDFLNETEISLTAKLDAGSGADADFLSIGLGRIKLGGAAKDDGEKGLIQTVPFQALLNIAGGAATAHERTTLWMQDSSLT